MYTYYLREKAKILETAVFYVICIFYLCEVYIF